MAMEWQSTPTEGDTPLLHQGYESTEEETMQCTRATEGKSDSERTRSAGADLRSHDLCARAQCVAAEACERTRSAGADVHSHDLCARAQCMAAEMLKQRIRFEALGTDLQASHAKELAKRVAVACSSAGAHDLLGTLCAGIAWLQAPVDSAQRDCESQKWVRQSVAEALRSLDNCSGLSRDFLAPALDILLEIVKAGEVALHQAAGSDEWLCISSNLHAQIEAASMLKHRKLTEPVVSSAGSSFFPIKKELEVPRTPKELEVPRTPKELEVPRTPIVKKDCEHAQGDVQTPAKRVKRSGVTNILWYENHGCWAVRFRDPVRGKHAGKQFSVRKYMKTGCTFEEADAAALQAAVAFRAELVQQGLLKGVKEAAADCSGTPDLSRKRSRRCWAANILIRGYRKCRLKSEPAPETDEACTNAEQQRPTREHECGLSLVHVQVKVKIEKQGRGVKGISWHHWDESWHADICVMDTTGMSRRFQRVFRPEDSSLEAIDRAHLEAVMWRDNLSQRAQS